MRRVYSLTIAAMVAALAVTWHLDAAAADDENPCQVDLVKFCSSVPVGGTQRLLCLQEHSADLSVGCREYLNKREPRRPHRRGDDSSRVWISACAEDVKKLCGGIAPGPGVISRCLDQHEASLSENCKLARAARKKS